MSIYLSKVSLVNFRNFKNAVLRFNPGVNTIIGENGAGKTNIFHAIRLLLDDTLPNSYSYFTEKDFNRGIGDWKGHWIIIRLEFREGLNNESVYSEKIISLLTHFCGEKNPNEPKSYSCSLVFRPNYNIRKELFEANGKVGDISSILEEISLEDYEVVRFGKGESDFFNGEDYKSIVGDFENNYFANPDIQEESCWLGTKTTSIFSLQREFNTAYIDALRDVQRLFRGLKRNPLRSILESKSTSIDKSDSFAEVVDIAIDLNNQINMDQDVKNLANEISGIYRETAGITYAPGDISIKSQLPTDVSSLFQSLSLYIGNPTELNKYYQGSIDELSLGNANMLYISLKLLEFKIRQNGKPKNRAPIANILLIEEPESHIHPHIQKVIFNNIGGMSETQVIYSTHSPQISEVSNVENVNVIVPLEGETWISCNPGNKLGKDKIVPINRFLDITRCNLLFSRGVILVEGDAEEIMIPYMIKIVYGISLDEIGISVINNRGTEFDNLASMFHRDRLRKRCAIVTDLDGRLNNKYSSDDAATQGVNRLNHLNNEYKNNEYVDVFYAKYTFEVDFALESENNRMQLIQMAEKKYAYKKTRIDIAKKFRSTDIDNIAKAALDLVHKDDLEIKKKGKGWTALMMVDYITKDTIVPQYILDALRFAMGGTVSPVVLNQISTYRGNKDRDESIIRLLNDGGSNVE